MPLNEKQRLRIAVAATGILALVLIYMVWHELRQISDLRAKVEASRNNIEQLNLEIADRAALDARKTFLQRTLEEDIKILPNETEVANFFYTTDRIEREAAVNPGINSTPMDTSVIKVKAGSGLEPHTWDLFLSGGFPQLIKFINLMESHERFFRVDKFEITPDLRSEDTTSKQMRLTVTTFTYRGVKEDATTPAK